MNKKILILLFLSVPFGLTAQVKLSGYVQTGLNYEENINKEKLSFQVKRLRVFTKGKVSEKVNFFMQVEGFSGIKGVKNLNGQRTIQLIDAFVTYKVVPEFSVRLGQFFMPLGYELYDISPGSLETADYSNIVYRISCRNPYEHNFTQYGRDIGIMFSGDLFDSGKDFSYLSYNVAVTNGAQQLKDDSNLMKDICASLETRPFKNWSIKASYNYGGYKDTATKVDDARMSRIIVGTWYNNPEGLNLRTEYGMMKSHTPKATEIDEAGAYVLVGYHFGKFCPLLRWDMYQDNVNPTTRFNFQRGLVGLIYEPKEKIKIQLHYDYTLFDDKHSNVSGLENSSRVQLMAVLKF